PNRNSTHPVTTVATETITYNYNVTVIISDTTTVTEVGYLMFTGTLSAPSSTDTTISYSFGGTATGGSDYSNTTTSVTIAAGETTATITVPTTDDGLVEDSESLSVTLNSLTGDPQITLSAATVATGMIDDNDSATVSISGTPMVTEGGDLIFTVMLSAPSSTDTTINYSFGGTADGATDYLNTTTSVTIAAGEATATITVLTTDDDLVEGSESLSLTLMS